MLKIGEFSKISRISIRMLRHYNEIGLLVPETVDKYTGYRYYSEEQLTIICKINFLKEMGFSLVAIKEIIKNYDNPDKLTQFLEIKKVENEEELRKAKNRMQLLDTALKRLRKDNQFMDNAVQTKMIPERYVASIRKIIPTYSHEGMLWNILGKESKDLKLKHSEPCYSMAVFHDNECKEKDVDVEIQIAVNGKYNDTENITFKIVPELHVASSTFKGSYDQITNVNSAIALWISENGYKLNGEIFCIYHVSPSTTDNPDELITEVCFPIVK